MKRLFTDSVRAGYTRAELEDLLARSEIVRGRVFNLGQSHIGIERPAVAPSEKAHEA